MGAIYSASDVIPSAIVQDKVATKALLDKFMLPNIAYQVLYENHPLESDLSFPVIVKPSYLGSSIGINVAKNEQELADALKEAFAYTALIRDIFYGGNISKIRRYLGNPTEEEIAQAKENIISYGEEGMVYGRKAGEIFAYLQQFSQEPMQKLLEKRRHQNERDNQIDE